MRSTDTLEKKSDGTKGHLHGKSLEHIFRAHHNMDVNTGDLLPGFTDHSGKGCECDHCKEYLQRGKQQPANQEGEAA